MASGYRVGVFLMVIAKLLMLFLTLKEITFEYDVCCWLLVNMYTFIKLKVFFFS